MRNSFEAPVNDKEKEVSPIPEPGQTEQKEKERVSAELTPEEKQEKEAVFEEVRGGLAVLYECFPRDKSIKKREVYRFFIGTYLEKLPPVPKDELAKAISTEELNKKPKEEFIARGLDVLDFWIHLRALGRNATKHFEQLQAELDAKSLSKESGVEPEKLPQENNPEKRADRQE